MGSRYSSPQGPGRAVTSSEAVRGEVLIVPTMRLCSAALSAVKSSYAHVYSEPPSAQPSTRGSAQQSTIESRATEGSDL